MSVISLGGLTAFTAWSPFGATGLSPPASASSTGSVSCAGHNLHNLASFTNWIPFGVSKEVNCNGMASNTTLVIIGDYTVCVMRILNPSTQVLLGSNPLVTSSVPCGDQDKLSPSLNNDSSSESNHLNFLGSHSRASSSSSSPTSDSSDGQASNESSSESDLTSISEAAIYDPWTPKVVFPSTKFPSLAIDPNFNVWSPSSDDEKIVEALARRSIETECISSDQLNISRQTSSVASSTFSSDQEEWGRFCSWSPMPTSDEAEILLEKAKALSKDKKREGSSEEAAKKKPARKCRRYTRKRLPNRKVHVGA